MGKRDWEEKRAGKLGSVCKIKRKMLIKKIKKEIPRENIVFFKVLLTALIRVSSCYVGFFFFVYVFL